MARLIVTMKSGQRIDVDKIGFDHEALMDGPFMLLTNRCRECGAERPPRRVRIADIFDVLWDRGRGG